MCHFYANALSPLLAVLQHNGGEPPLQSEQLESVRNLPSFRALVESHVDNGDAESLERARSLIEDDETLIAEIKKGQSIRDTWIRDALRALLVQEAAGALQGEFSSAYIAILGEGASGSEHSRLVECVRQLEAPALASFLRQTIRILKEGDPILISQSPTASLREDADMEGSLSKLLTDLEALQALASEAGITLRSSYSGQSKIMRTTVIAQRVQLSRDTAALREQDKQFTSIVDGVTRELGKHIRVSPLGQVFLSESWTYDSHSPLRDVLVPRPRPIFERSLTRPHDYLGCNCCKDGSGGIQATLPATAILYQLYLETGNLINVADLWSAFHGHVSQDEEDERKILFSFYRGLAELKTLGFVKSSKKKADHIAKLKWL
jgi:origin recognition complex subunit 3